MRVPVAGPTRPTAGSPPRRAATCRRTMSIDIAWQRPDGRGVVLTLTGHARDVVGDRVVDEAGVVAEVDKEWRIVAVRSEPHRALDGLVGAGVRSGFRARAAEVVPDPSDSPLGQLLDDLPVAALIAGYATMREANRAGVEFRAEGVVDRMRDQCAGWRSGGGLLTSVETGGGVPLQPMVAAPELRRPDDPGGWHDMAPLPPLSMRRVRRIDVDPDGRVDAMFRDTYGEPDGTETVLHEYGVVATLDPGSLTVADIAASPHVLPWGECPAAAANVGDLVDVAAPDLRTEAPARLGGIRGCTHLNDLLRSLAAAGRLARIAGAGGMP